MDTISRIKKSRSVIFRFESLLTHIFFYATNKFPSITNWNETECAIQLITFIYRSRPEVVIDNDIDRIMKSFQVEMNQRYRIPPALVEKYKDELCFMVKIDFPWVKFIEPMGYEMSEELIEGYA